MTTMIVQHTVTDYDAWRPLFDEHSAVRDAHGCRSTAVFRSVDDPNAVTVIMEYPSVADAQAFGADPSLKDAMANGGVVGAPQISLLESTEALA